MYFHIEKHRLDTHLKSHNGQTVLPRSYYCLSHLITLLLMEASPLSSPSSLSLLPPFPSPSPPPLPRHTLREQQLGRWGETSTEAEGTVEKDKSLQAAFLWAAEEGVDPYSQIYLPTTLHWVQSERWGDTDRQCVTLQTLQREGTVLNASFL